MTTLSDLLAAAVRLEQQEAKGKALAGGAGLGEAAATMPSPGAAWSDEEEPTVGQLAAELAAVRALLERVVPPDTDGMVEGASSAPDGFDPDDAAFLGFDFDGDDDEDGPDGFDFADPDDDPDGDGDAMGDTDGDGDGPDDDLMSLPPEVLAALGHLPADQSKAMACSCGSTETDEFADGTVTCQDCGRDLTQHKSDADLEVKARRAAGVNHAAAGGGGAPSSGGGMAGGGNHPAGHGNSGAHLDSTVTPGHGKPGKFDPSMVAGRAAGHTGSNDKPGHAGGGKGPSSGGGKTPEAHGGAAHAAPGDAEAGIHRDPIGRFAEGDGSSGSSSGGGKATPDNTEGAGGPPHEPGAGKPYTVKPGDTLWAIAERELGDGSKWKQIRDASGLGKNFDPTKMAVGTKLTIPQSGSSTKPDKPAAGKPAPVGAGVHKADDADLETKSDRLSELEVLMAERQRLGV